MLLFLSDWTSAISLIFGGCCTNAVTLEQITHHHPNAGSILTFFQFLVVSLYGLPKFLIWTRFGPRFRPRRIPLLVYFAQVVLFYLVSVLNNAAFAYQIPMAVHIIFRSGGLVVTMFLGWLVSNKRYDRTQIGSVILVTAGVVLTTLSATSSKSSTTTTVIDPYIYTQGILILILALILSGFLGIVQDWAQAKRRSEKSTSPKNPTISDAEAPAPWQESMFYLHFLALPLFLPLLPDLAAQMQQLNTRSPRASFTIPIPIPLQLSLSPNKTNTLLPPYSIPNLDFPIHIFPKSNDGTSFLSIIHTPTENSNYPFLFSLSIPHIYLPIVLNTLTQLLCIAGVNRLTTRVSSLTVNLVLVIRKALSLVISVFGIEKMGEGMMWIWRYFVNRFGGPTDDDWTRWMGDVDVGALMSGIGRAFVGERSSKRPQAVNIKAMSVGAGMVLLGTLGYALGGKSGKEGKVKVGAEKVNGKEKDE